MTARDRDDASAFERDLAGLPELDVFTTDDERASAVRAVGRRIENPYAIAYWVWVGILLGVAIAASRLVGWSAAGIGLPWPLPAATAIAAGIGVYALSARTVIRWAARAELRREI